MTTTIFGTHQTSFSDLGKWGLRGGREEGETEEKRAS